MQKETKEPVTKELTTKEATPTECNELKTIKYKIDTIEELETLKNSLSSNEYISK